jgi:hypothetical protein
MSDTAPSSQGSPFWRFSLQFYRLPKVADACICLVRIASTTTKTYGSGWTADYAERQGKSVQRYYINTDTGEVQEGNWNGEG